MDVDGEKLGNAALEKQRQRLAVLPPKPMADAIALEGVEALIVEKRLDEGMAGRIAVQHRREIGADRLTDGGIVAQRLLEHLARQKRIEIVAAELAGEMI